MQDDRRLSIVHYGLLFLTCSVGTLIWNETDCCGRDSWLFAWVLNNGGVWNFHCWYSSTVWATVFIWQELVVKFVWTFHFFSPLLFFPQFLFVLISSCTHSNPSKAETRYLKFNPGGCYVLVQRYCHFISCSQLNGIDLSSPSALPLHP